ncbi:MAG TPA: lysophospholipid acyltransferase family protein [Pseudomonadales bacterium]|nr:lysophospholipid acyltransferase family protein [Pseudomonadales bacterium]
MAKLYFLPRALLKEHNWILRTGWRIESAFIRFVIRMLQRLPLARATERARRLCAAIGPHTGLNEKLLRNQAILHPDESLSALQARARNTFGWAGVAIAEITQLETIVAHEDEWVEFEIHPSVAEVVNSADKAAVMVTAHVGPWTLTNLIAGHFGFRLTTVYAPESNPAVRDQILALRSAMAVNLIERDNSMRKLIGELRGGHKIGLATDVRLDGGPMLPLFGHPMETNSMPARLAQRQGCPLIPVRAIRLPGGRFRIIAEAAVGPDDPDADLEERILQTARNMTAVYERWIREDPDQWLCMARRWPKDLERASLERARARR